MASPHASVIIPNYNGRRFLPKLLESLAAQRGAALSVFLVDDASGDDSAAYVQSEWPEVRLIRNSRNLGFAASCNAGLRQATTPFVVLLNNDTHVEADWLVEGLRPFDEPDVGSVASLALLAEPPHLIDTAGDIYSVAGGAVKRKHLGPREDAEAMDSAPFSPSGVSAFYRRDALEKVGLLDERFESYYEDVDLGFRLAWAGYRCAFAPLSICYHHLSASYHPRSWRYHFNSARNAEIVWWSHMPRRARYLPAHLAFLAMQLVNKTRQGVGPAYVAGKVAAWGHMRHVIKKRRASVGHTTLPASTIEAQLVRDWWTLHVRSRRSNVVRGRRS